MRRLQWTLLTLMLTAGPVAIIVIAVQSGELLGERFWLLQREGVPVEYVWQDHAIEAIVAAQFVAVLIAIVWGYWLCSTNPQRTALGVVAVLSIGLTFLIWEAVYFYIDL